MLAIDRQAQKILRQSRLIHQLFLLIIALASIIIILAVMIFAMTQSASANAVCLSKRDARALWPKAHLYWYSKNHCWSNRRGPPRNLKLDPVVTFHAELLPEPIYDVLPRPRPKADRLKPDPPDDCCWPNLDQLLAEDKETPLRWLVDKLNQK